MPLSRKIFQVLPDIYDAAVDGDHWQKALDSLADAIGARGTTLMAYDLVDTPFRIHAWNSLYSAEDIKEYSQKYAKYEAEIAKFMHYVEPRKIVRDTEVWPELVHSRNREDIDFLRTRYGVQSRTGAYLNPRKAWKDLIAFQMAEDWVDVPDSFWKAFEMVIPHLSKSVEVGRTFSLLHLRYRAILAALDNLGIGICIATHAGWIAVANAEAQNILSANDGLVLSKEQRLVARNEDVTQQIREGIELTAHTASGRGNSEEIAIVCPRLSGATPFLIEICPLRDSAAELEADFSGSLVCIIDPDRTTEISTKGMAQIYGLSPAEAAVCESMIHGRTAAEIAEERGVSPETVRSQARAVYAKANIASRIELIRLAQQLNPPIR